ncbi:sporulation protein YqfD [Bacillus sp. FSL K6-3431]|uniref:sporulation protein YqfD n=1 Tax=Bacillus sp. FSL K6-3431 TaxID=2921500 RepID=UPI0030FBAB2F
MRELKNQWFTFLSGRVLVNAQGSGLERLINKLARSNIALWKLKKKTNEELLFYIALGDLHKLRKVVRGSDCHISFLRGEGIPFLWKRTKKNSGFAFGLFLSIVLILLLSNITWGIHIEGANPETEHKIRRELNALGVKVGTFHFLNDDPEMIQKKLSDRIENLTWIGVELKGTTFHFKVVEKTEPELIEEKSPAHLVAKKKAIISHMFIEKGKSLVKIHQYVEKGQMLVSGTIGNEDKQVNIPARGEVWGHTWYNSKVEFPLESSFQVYSGEEKRIHSLEIGKLNIPVWGFGKIPFSKYETEKEEHDLHFLGWKLPIKYVDKTLREKEESHRSLTKKEAIEAAKELAKRDLKINIPEDARLDKEYILHEDVENGKVKLSINFQVIENIAEEKTIIQGD